MNIGERIKQLRREKGLTQEQLAEKIGVERSSIGKYEGKSKNVIPSDDVKARLADFFGVSVDFLIGLSDIRSQTGCTSLSKDENDLLEIFRQLNQEGKSLLLDQAVSILTRPSMRKEESMSSMA